MGWRAARAESQKRWDLKTREGSETFARHRLAARPVALSLKEPPKREGEGVPC